MSAVLSAPRNTNKRNSRLTIFFGAMLMIAVILFVPPARAAIATTTTLTLSASTVASGTAVTLTATVSNGAALTVGTVTFCDATAAFCLNGAVIGTAQLTAAGTAAFKFIPAIGSHSYKAVFTPSNGNLGSASTAQGLTVTGPHPSTTAISSSGAAGAYTLTGTVVGFGSTTLSPAGGSVSFLDTTNANTVLGSGTLGTATLAQAFAGQATYATGTVPQSEVAGDFNGDGKVDLAVVNNTGNTVSIFLGNGDGTFQAGIPYAAGSLPYAIAAGDFLGNGKFDLAITNLNGNAVMILIGNGDGTFQAPVPYTVGSDPISIAVADLNADGKLDLVVANSNSANVSVLLGNGDGTFQPQATYGTGAGSAAVVVGDFNGDGIPDLAVANKSTTTVSILLGVGDGSFNTEVPITVGSGPTSISVGDLNGDGVLDLMTTNSNDNMVSVLIGIGNGSFQPQVIYAVGNTPLFGGFGDFDGDGKVDLVALNSGNGTVSVLLGVGDGTFLPQAVYSTGTDPVSLAIADFNGDGFADLAVVNNTGNTISVLLDLITQTTSFAGSGISIPGSGTAHLVDASYAGDTNFAASVSSTTSLTSTQITTALVLTANVGSSTYGQSVTLTATLNPSASGGLVTTGDTVTFKIGAATLGTGNLNNLGVATLTLTTLPAGADSLTAVFPGDANFLADTSAPLSFTVSQAILLVTAQNASRIYGAANPVFTAAFSGFVNGDTQLSATTGAPSLTTTATAISPVTTYPIAAAIGTLASANYSFTFVNGTLTVTQAVLTVTANDVGRIYGAVNPPLTAVISGFVNGDTQLSATTGAPGLATAAIATSPVGNYLISATIGTLASTNYSFVFVNGLLDVHQAILTVTANDAGRIYGAINPPLIATITGFVNGDTQLSATTGSPSVTTTATGISPVGNYPITVTLGTLASANYSFVFVNGLLDVHPAVLTVTANNVSKAYGAANPTFTAAFSGFVNGDTQLSATTGAPSLTTTATAASVVGGYPITAALGTLASTNYTFVFVNGTLTVTQTVLTVTANNVSKLYGAVNPAFTSVISGFVNGDTQLSATMGAPSLTTTATAASPVGGYPITAALGTLASTNYSFVFVNGVLTVNQAVLTVTANNFSRAYGAVNPSLTAAITGFVNGDTQLSATTGAPTVTTLATVTSPVGGYAITAALGTLASTNYSFVFVNGTLTVTQAVLTVTANSLSKTYGAVNPTLTAGITGFVNGDTQLSATTGTPTLATTATAASVVGGYPITVTLGTLASTNYSFVFVNGTLTVTQAILTVTANNVSKIYGAVNPTLTDVISGFVNGDTLLSSTTGAPSLTTTATAASSVGAYPITAALGTLASTNYSFVFMNGVLTVNQAVLTITANNFSRIYGAANPAFTAVLSGFVNGDTQLSATTGAPSLTTLATVSSPVGGYPITAGVGTLVAPNYSFTFVNGTLTITQAVLTVTANNISKAYGAANPTFTASFTGFANGDTQMTATSGAPSLTTTATAASVVGTYPITAALGTLASTNYSFVFVNGILTVNQAVLTVTANNVSKIYGAANPALTATLTGFVNGDTQVSATTGAPALATTATLASIVGSYPITVTVGTLAATNYTFAFVNGTLTVTQAVLTVTAQNASRAYGAANPTFTAVLSGFVNGDTQLTATTGAANLTTTALVTSPVGPYPITPALGSLAAANYSFIFVNGTLTVNQAVLTVTANNATRIFGAANPVFTATFTGFANGDTVATATTGAPILTTTATLASVVGTYPITVTVGTMASTNYSFTFVNGVLTVSLATPVITWANPAAITFGTALTATQLDATASTAGTFVYSPTAGTIPSGGTQILSVTFTPTDVTDFSTAVATVTLIVNKALPVITWLTPAAITHGTLLSATQLDATASVPGTFVYAPAAGTAPAAGSDILSVTFTPTDAIEYSTATATVTISVTDITMISFTPTTETISSGDAASFLISASPVGTATFASAVTFSASGLPPTATFTATPATIPAGSGATNVTLTILTTAFSNPLNTVPREIAPRNQLLALSAVLFLLMLTTQLFRKRATLTPRLMILMLLAAPCLAAVVGLTACSSASGGGHTYPIVITETSGAETHTLNLVVILKNN